MSNGEFTREGLKIEMITVQGKSVVSKTLINRPTGTVTLGFDRGEKLSEHRPPSTRLFQFSKAR